MLFIIQYAEVQFLIVTFIYLQPQSEHYTHSVIGTHYELMALWSVTPETLKVRALFKPSALCWPCDLSAADCNRIPLAGHFQYKREGRQTDKSVRTSKWGGGNKKDFLTILTSWLNHSPLPPQLGSIHQSHVSMSLQFTTQCCWATLRLKLLPLSILFSHCEERANAIPGQ